MPFIIYSHCLDLLVPYSEWYGLRTDWMLASG